MTFSASSRTIQTQRSVHRPGRRPVSPSSSQETSDDTERRVRLHVKGVSWVLARRATVTIRAAVEASPSSDNRRFSVSRRDCRFERVEIRVRMAPRGFLSKIDVLIFRSEIQVTR
jgi:hypothetical protein